MTKAEILQLARKKIAGNVSIREAVIKSYCVKLDEKNYSEEEVEDIIGKVRKYIKIYERIHTQIDPEFTADETEEVCPADLFHIDFLNETLKAWASALCVRIFNKPEPPFSAESMEESIKQAATWIKEEAEKAIPPDVQAKISLYDEKMRELKALLAEGKAIGHWTHKSDVLTFVNRDLQSDAVNITGQKNLTLLKIECEKLSKNTGINPAALLLYILTGIIPPVHLIQITKYERRDFVHNFTHRFYDIKVHAEGVTTRELKEALMSRCCKNDKKQKQPTKEDYLFYKLVEETGKPPTNNGSWKEYWNHIGEIWFKQPDKHMASYMKYKRLLKKLGREGT